MKTFIFTFVLSEWTAHKNQFKTVVMNIAINFWALAVRPYGANSVFFLRDTFLIRPYLDVSTSGSAGTLINSGYVSAQFSVRVRFSIANCTLYLSLRRPRLTQSPQRLRKRSAKLSDWGEVSPSCGNQATALSHSTKALALSTKKSLSLHARLELAHTSLADPGRLVRLLCPIILILLRTLV